MLRFGRGRQHTGARCCGAAAEDFKAGWPPSRLTGFSFIEASRNVGFPFGASYRCSSMPLYRLLKAFPVGGVGIQGSAAPLVTLVCIQTTVGN
jgi:hypothetical protein